MDTRTKILSIQETSESPGPRAVVACEFNVLRAEHARRIAEFRESVPGHTLIAAVLPVGREVLPRRARAELLAALRAVDRVVIVDAIEPLRPAAVLRLGESDVFARVRRGNAC